MEYDQSSLFYLAFSTCYSTLFTELSSGRVSQTRSGSIWHSDGCPGSPFCQCRLKESTLKAQQGLHRSFEVSHLVGCTPRPELQTLPILLQTLLRRCCFPFASLTVTGQLAARVQWLHCHTVSPCAPGDSAWLAAQLSRLSATTECPRGSSPATSSTSDAFYLQSPGLAESTWTAASFDALSARCTDPRSAAGAWVSCELRIRHIWPASAFAAWCSFCLLRWGLILFSFCVGEDKESQQFIQQLLIINFL